MSARLLNRSWAARRRTARARRDEHGFFTIWVLGLCALVLGLGGLSYDLWHAFSDRRELSSMVDAAAVAGASQINLDAFRQNSTVVQVDRSAASQRAAAYLAQASAEAGMQLFDESIEFQGDSVVITASTDTKLTLTQLLVPGGKYTVTVRGVANPERTENE